MIWVAGNYTKKRPIKIRCRNVTGLMYCAAARENVARASVLQLSARLRRRDGKSDVMIDRSHLHYDVMCA